MRIAKFNKFIKLKTAANILKDEGKIENREPGEEIPIGLLNEDVAKAIQMPENGKSAGVDKIPAEIPRYMTCSTSSIALSPSVTD